MSKLFTPISIGLGVLAGVLSTKIFDFIWSKFDDEDAPNPKFREQSYVQLTIALAIQGVIQRLVRGYVDHGSRQLWANATGSWPGDERPQPED